MPEDASKTVTPHLEFSVGEWTGPAGFSLIQGLKWAGRDYFVYQADKKAGGEDLVIRRYGPDRKYKGFLTIPNGGHGSSTGVMQINDTTSRHFIPADERGIRVVDYVIGNPGTPKSSFLGAVGWCSAVSVNNSANRFSVRKGGGKQTVTWFNRDAILKGEKPEPELKYSFDTPSSATFQGHYNFGDSDYFHWETAGPPRGSARYRSWAERWQKGKKVATLNTTPWQPKGEPQGFAGINGKLYFVKRVGGLNKGRYVLAVPCNI